MFYINSFTAQHIQSSKTDRLYECMHQHTLHDTPISLEHHKNTVNTTDPWITQFGNTPHFSRTITMENSINTNNKLIAGG